MFDRRRLISALGTCAAAFRHVLAQLGCAEGHAERLPALAAEPVRHAVTEATAMIPIVTISGSDLVEAGWAKSPARPGSMGLKLPQSLLLRADEVIG